MFCYLNYKALQRMMCESSAFRPPTSKRSRECRWIRHPPFNKWWSASFRGSTSTTLTSQSGWACARTTSLNRWYGAEPNSSGTHKHRTCGRLSHCLQTRTTLWCVVNFQEENTTSRKIDWKRCSNPCGNGHRRDDCGLSLHILSHTEGVKCLMLRGRDTMSGYKWPVCPLYSANYRE